MKYSQGLRTVDTTAFLHMNLYFSFRGYPFCIFCGQKILMVVMLVHDSLTIYKDCFCKKIMKKLGLLQKRNILAILRTVYILAHSFGICTHSHIAWPMTTIRNIKNWMITLVAHQTHLIIKNDFFHRSIVRLKFPKFWEKTDFQPTGLLCDPPKNIRLKWIWICITCCCHLDPMLNISLIGRHTAL